MELENHIEDQKIENTERVKRSLIKYHKKKSSSLLVRINMDSKIDDYQK